MASLLSPVIANFFMGNYEGMSLSRVAYKPTCLFHCVFKISKIWPHGPKELNDFLNHLSSFHPSIQSTVETELNGHLPFLDITYTKTRWLLGLHCVQEAHPHHVSEC